MLTKDRVLDSISDLNQLKGFKIVSINIRSLTSKIAQLEALLDSTKVDALCINESWLNENVNNNQIRIDEYKIYRLDRKEKKRGGGLCAYINGKHRVDAHKYSDLNRSDKNLEAMVLEVQQKCTKPKIFVLLYRPPQGKIEECMSSLRDLLSNLNTGLEIFIRRLKHKLHRQKYKSS